MIVETQKMYEVAYSDEQFIKDIQKEEPTTVIPNQESDDISKTLFAAYYYGYLIGKGRYKKGMFAN